MLDLPERYEKFNRKTFDPVNKHGHAIALSVLRGPGGRRWFLQGCEDATGRRNSGLKASSSLSLGINSLSGPLEGKTLIDAGCGDSGDADFWVENGGDTGMGYDLFPRKETHDFGDYVHKRKSTFRIQDICEPWPNENGSVDLIICHAVIDLLAEEDRALFYTECVRVLKEKDGVLVVKLIPLINGHDYNYITEMDRMESCGLDSYVDSLSSGTETIVAFRPKQIN